MLQKGSLDTLGIVCAPVETQRIVSIHVKMIQMLVVIGWVRSRTQGRIVVQMSDPLSLAHCRWYFAVRIRRLVETQLDVEVESRIGRIKYIKLFCTEL